ncbi:hypothetical protein IQ06DRAFT_101880 [Phaeosphaeriaceae sp. SRC1lsM3a]|nr:hypothetical protein IQ06DRAFT_101880 [Stagonospora sp. SRC1lsM3a]
MPQATHVIPGTLLPIRNRPRHLGILARMFLRVVVIASICRGCVREGIIKFRNGVFAQLHTSNYYKLGSSAALTVLRLGCATRRRVNQTKCNILIILNSPLQKHHITRQTHVNSLICTQPQLVPFLNPPLLPRQTEHSALGSSCGVRLPFTHFVRVINMFCGSGRMLGARGGADGGCGALGGLLFLEMG